LRRVTKEDGKRFLEKEGTSPSKDYLRVGGAASPALTAPAGLKNGAWRPWGFCEERAERIPLPSEDCEGKGRGLSFYTESWDFVPEDYGLIGRTEQEKEQSVKKCGKFQSERARGKQRETPKNTPKTAKQNLFEKNTRGNGCVKKKWQRIGE